MITEFDNQPVLGNDSQELAKLIFQKKIGDKIKIVVWRNGEVFSKEIILESA